MRIGSHLEGVKRCPQCGVADPLLYLKGGFPDSFKHETAAYWFTYQCSRCSDLVAVKGFVSRKMVGTYDAMAIAINWPPKVVQMLPTTQDVGEDVPEPAKNFIEQARLSLEAPDGAVMLAGSAVDAMLKLKGYDKNSLYERIDQAVADNLLTVDMGEWAHSVRLGSNAPRHADINNPHATSEEAKSSLALAEMLAKILFSIPAQVSRGKLAAKTKVT